MHAKGIFIALMLTLGLVAAASVSCATPPPTFTVYTDQIAFQAALDALAPGTRRNINWDATPINGNKTIAIPAGANAQQQFLGVIFSRPVIAEADVLMGEEGEAFGDVADLTDSGSVDVVVTDDFVFQAATTSIPTISSVTVRRNGVLVVNGIGFVEGSRIVVNGTSHDTANVADAPNRKLASAEAGAFLRPNDISRIQVVNPDGTLSKVIEFSR